MWHHFKLTHSQPLAVQRRVTLSAEEWNYLQLSVIGAASAISLIVSTISQRWTNGDGLELMCHHTVCGLVEKTVSYVLLISRNCSFQAWAGERWYLAGRSPLQSGSPGFCVLTNLLGQSRFLEIETLSGLQWWQLGGKAQEISSKLPCWAEKSLPGRIELQTCKWMVITWLPLV